MAQVNITYVFSPSTTIKSAEVNKNFEDIANYVNELFQTGIVFYFYGDVSQIPPAYYYCDGTNGTPDCRRRFIMGVGMGVPLGSTGGSESASLVTANIPPHTHTGTTNTTGSHSHSGSIRFAGGSYIGSFINAYPTSATPSSSVKGSNTVYGSTGSNGSHSHTFVTNSVGSSASFSIINRFIALVPIMIK